MTGALVTRDFDTLRDAAVQGPLVTLALAAPWIIATSWPLAGAGEGRLAA